MFTTNKDHFTAVVEFACSYYKEHKSEDSDHVALTLSGSELRDITGFSANSANDRVACDVHDDIAESVGIISSEFHCLWVNDMYVIFWKDETKYYGLLWSLSTRKAISSVKERYTGLDYRKLESNWYEIGVLNSI